MILAVVTLVLAGCGDSGPAITVKDAVMPVPGANGQTSVYLTIVNDGDGSDRLYGAATKVAPMAMLHQTEIDPKGTATMDEPGRVEIPADGSVAFKPGGRHVMLMGPKELEPGDTFTLELDFGKSGPVKTTVRVVRYADLDLKPSDTEPHQH